MGRETIAMEDGLVKERVFIVVSVSMYYTLGKRVAMSRGSAGWGKVKFRSDAN